MISEKMKVALIVSGAVMSLVASSAGICIVSYVSANNYGSRTESLLKAERDNNKNTLSQYSQQMQEAAQVPSMYTDDFNKIIKSSMEGRYGDGGSKATFQWIKEHDIKLDSQIYTKLQNMIEGGRRDFQFSQTKMLDIRKGYEAQLGYVWRGMWLKMAGYPKINFADYQPVTTAEVEQAFKNGVEAGPIKLR